MVQYKVQSTYTGRVALKVAGNLYQPPIDSGGGSFLVRGGGLTGSIESQVAGGLGG